MKQLLGTKMGMTQFFDTTGRAHAATMVQVTPATVTQVKTTSSPDGYDAIQIATGEKREKNITKPLLGHFGDLGKFRFVREFRVENPMDYARGQVIGVDIFAPNEIISISGISKGKGFQGVVKRHGFHGGRRTHGQKHSEREAGSIGPGGLQRVAKGMRMAGRMGSDRTTVKNLKVLAVDSTRNIMIVKGALPGKPGTLLEITA